MYARLQKAYPTLTNALTGFGVMVTGDSAVQFGIERAEVWDKQRTGVCSCYSFVYAPPLAMWFGYMDRCFPGASMVQFASKLVINQTVSSCLLTPGFLMWSSTIEEVVRGKGVLAGVERARKTLQQDGLMLVAGSWCSWLPINALIFKFAPVHARIAWISSYSVLWLGYSSWVAHGRIERAPDPNYGV